MNLRRYLPTRQFSFIALSFLLSAGLVFAADWVTHKDSRAALAVDTNTGSQATVQNNTDWQAALGAVQEQSGISLPEPPDQTTVQGLLQAAQSSNITDTLSRSVLVNLVNAKGQGLGDDMPTQNQIINTALTQLRSTAKKTYTKADFTVTDSSAAALKTYGNRLAIYIEQNTAAQNDYAKTLIAIDNATTSNDPEVLKELVTIQKHYEMLASGLTTIPVPQTLVPFHLQLTNNFAQIAATYPEMQKIITDPVAGLAGAQQYNALTAEAARVFINIAQSFDKNAILFNTDEPGALWKFLLQQQQ